MTDANQVSPFLSLIDERSNTAKASKPLVLGPQKLGYGDLAKRIGKLTGLFRRFGLATGDRVLLASQDDLAVVSFFFAMLRNGITSVVVDPGSTEKELETMIEAADVAAVVADDEVLDRIKDRPVMQQLNSIEIGGTKKGKAASLLGRFSRRASESDETLDSFPSLLDSVEEVSDLPDVIPETTTAYILFTSGTTSQPKGVEISHRALYAQMQTFVRQYGYNADSRLSNILPLHHTDGLTQGPVVAYVAEATVCRPLRFRVDRLEELLETIYADRVTHLITVPSVLALILNLSDECDWFDTSDFAFVISTAAFLDEKLWRDFEEKFDARVVNVYGLTETVCESFYCGPDETTRRIGTIGKPVDCAARIVDDTGKDLPPGEMGELILSGDHIMTGYFRMPQETSEVLKDGWFYTGDLASVDEDGFYWILGRKKNVIICGGINVYPEEVTQILRSLPGVLDAVTLGLEDDLWGERVVSCVIPVQGEDLSQQKLTEAFLELASQEKLPAEIILMEEFPRGPAGKVVLQDLKNQILARGKQSDLSQTKLDLETKVRETAARIFKVPFEEISLGSDPENTRGWSSLAHVEFLLQLEKEFEIRMSPQSIMNIKSVEDALHAVEREVAS